MIAILARRPPPDADALVPSHEDDVDDAKWEPIVDLIALGDVPKSERIVAPYGAGHGVERAEDRSEDRGLPGAVRPDESQKIALRNVKCQIRKHHATPVAERRVVEPNERTHAIASARRLTS